MRKGIETTLTVLAASVWWVLVVSFLGIVVLTIWNLIPSSEPSGEASFRFIREESYMEGYDLTDYGTVKIRYSICFVNNTGNDMTVGVGATFRKREIRGWLEDQLLFGYDENGEQIVVRANQKENITLVFEGEYLGGSVNENLSFPKTLVLGLHF